MVQEATSDDEPTPETDERILMGASNGGKARAAKLTAEQRSQIAKKAASTRWAARNSGE